MEVSICESSKKKKENENKKERNLSICSNISDIRLKENIEVITYNATEKLLQLVPKSYNMIEHPTISKSGFIAQELKEILPEFVNGTESENEYLGIDYNGILALAVKAIQELKGEIDILKAR